MALLKDLFRPATEKESIILVDIGARVVVGGYAHFVKGAAPTLVYEKRVDVEFREGELQEVAMLRALKTLGDTLVREGAPVLVRATGSGVASGLLVSIDAPWQKASVRSEYIEDKKPFIFTSHLVTSVLEKTKAKASGKTLVDESVIGTILNGYETKSPYGREAHRAEIVILTSLIDEAVADNIITLLRGIFHTKRILPIAGSSLRYQAMRSAFPHERDALIIDVTGPSTSIALIRRDLLISIIQITDDLPTIEAWVQKMVSELGELARHYPLPRTIFLLTREPEAVLVQKTLAGAKLGDLWLSDTPPTIVPVLANHLTKLVRQSTVGTPDVLMLLMALYWQNRGPAVEL